jgi:hypothetical protein
MTYPLNSQRGTLYGTLKILTYMVWFQELHVSLNFSGIGLLPPK